MTHKLGVCHVITRLIVGGAQEAAVLTCARVDAERFDSALVIGPETGTEGSLRPLAEALGVPMAVVPPLVRRVAPVNDVRAARALRQLFRARKPEIVHTHSSKAGVLGRWAAHRERVAAIVHTVHGWSFHDHMHPLVRASYIHLERRAARWCDRIVTVSDLDREKGLAVGIGSPDQYVTIREVNDLAPYEEHAGERGAARRRLGLPDDCPVVGTASRFSEQKDPRTWVRTAAAIAQQQPDAQFVMIGDGPLRSEAERVAAELGLAARLVTTGLRDDVPELLPAFDVFLLTSRWEGLPLVIPQAMASGVPVVASSADGNREVVRHGENGLLVAPQDPEAAASGTMTLIEDTSLRDHLVAGGRRTARAFELGQTIPHVEELYRECVRDGGRRTSSIMPGGGSA